MTDWPDPRPAPLQMPARALPRVAYLTGEYPRATDTFIQREVAGLRALGFDIRTCSIRRTGADHIVGPEQAAEQAGTFHILPATLSPSLFGALIHHLRRPRRFLQALALAWQSAPKGLRGRAYNLVYFAEGLVLSQWMTREGVDHLHNHIAKASCTVAMLAAHLADIPYSFTLHGPDDLAEPAHWRLDLKIRRARFVACISHYCRAQAMAQVDQSHWPRLSVVHCGVDPALYDHPRPQGGLAVGSDETGQEAAPVAQSGAGPAQERPHYAADRQRLLFVGRLAAVKGVPVLFAALQRLIPAHPALRLTLIGDGPERAALEAQAAQMGLADRLDFRGYQSQSAVAEALKNHDILVLPSFAEGVPVVLMEAMAARLPVVASRVAGVPELITDGESGILVAAGDAQDLARGLAAAIAAPPAMGEAARKAVIAGFDSRNEAARLGRLLVGG